MISLRRLWRRRIQVAIGAVVAVAIAFALGGSAVPRSAVGATRVLIDTPRSDLVAVSSRGMDSLSWRATLLAMLLGTETAHDQLAREMGVAVGQVAVVDQELTTAANPAALPVAALLSASETPEPYVLKVATDDSLPIVSIQTSAADRTAAARLAAAAVHVLESGASPRDTPDLQGLRFEQIDPVTAVEIAGRQGRTKTAMTAVFVFCVWCIALLFWPGRREPRRWSWPIRRARSAGA
jgi:hypothetical protein